MRIRVGTFFPNSGTVVESIKARILGEGVEDYEAKRSTLPAAAEKEARALLAESLPECDFKFAFSEKAGCTSCPCSPGFVITAAPTTPRAEYNLEMFRIAHTGRKFDGRRYVKKEAAYDRFAFWAGEDGALEIAHRSGETVIDRKKKAEV